MLSRVADAVHWMARYIERAESIGRFVDVHEHLTLDMPGDQSHQWQSLVSATGDDTLFSETYGEFDRASVLKYLLFDKNYPSSVWACLAAARENARSVREIVSSDMWSETNRAYHFVKRSFEDIDGVISNPEPFLQRLKNACFAIQGATEGTMTHGDAWHFYRIGLLLERADKTSRILDVKYFVLGGEPDKPEHDILWGALLQSVSGLEMYRQRFRRLRPHKVLSFLLFDPTFPRSIRCSIEGAEASLRAFNSRPNRAKRLLGKLRAELEFGTVEEVLEHGMHKWIDELQAALNEISQALNEQYLHPVGYSAEQHQSQG